MRDRISEMRIKDLHPKVLNDFKSFIEEAEESLNITLRITQGLRTMREQQTIYNQGRTAPGIKVTNAKPGQSYHNYGLAVDLVRMDGKKVDWNYKMSNLLPFSKKYNIFWGGNFKSFKDEPHFEKTLGFHWRALFEKYNKKDFNPNTDYVNI